jgi:hypothetical protein
MGAPMGMNEVQTGTSSNFEEVRKASVKINGEKAFGFWSSTNRDSRSSYSNGFNGSTSDLRGPQTWTVPFTFDNDPAINGGASTPATLTFETIANGPGTVEVQLVSYTYDETVTNTPLEMLEQAKTILNGLADALKPKTVRPNIGGSFNPEELTLIKANTDLAKCLDPRNFQMGGLLLNTTRGQVVYQYCMNILEILQPYSRANSAFGAEVREAVDLITEADLQFAFNAYDVASFSTENQAQNALTSIDNAQNAQANGELSRAATDAAVAWRFVIAP